MLKRDVDKGMYKEDGIIPIRFQEYTMNTLQWTPMFYILSLGVGFILAGYYFAAMIF